MAPVLPVVAVAAAVPVAVVGVVDVPVVVVAGVVVTGGIVRLLAVDPAGVLTAGVTTVVTGVPVPVEGTTIGAPAGVSDDWGGCVAGGVIGGGGVGTAGAMVRTTGGPSGSTQLTSLFEQKLGIDVRSVDRSAANASPAPVPANIRMTETVRVFFMAWGRSKN
jgi:hypothetical protein